MTLRTKRLAAAFIDMVALPILCASNNVRQFGCRDFRGKMTAELEAQNGQEEVDNRG